MGKLQLSNLTKIVAVYHARPWRRGRHIGRSEVLLFQIAKSRLLRLSVSANNRAARLNFWNAIETILRKADVSQR